MNKEEIKNIVKENLYKKKVVLFGAGKVATDFYMKYKNELDIVYCFSNKNEEWGKQLCGEIEVRKYDKTLLSKDIYIIICVKFPFVIIYHQLLADGLEMFEDINDYRLVQAIISKKKIAVFRGTCVLEDAYIGIRQVKAFNDEYAGIFVGDMLNDTKYKNPLLLHAAKICDVYVYSLRSMSLDPVCKLQPDELPSDCIQISVSHQSFIGYWPQANPDINHYNSEFISSYNSNTAKVIYRHNMFLYSDLFLDELIDKGYGTEEIISIVSDENFISKEDMDKFIRKALIGMQMADYGADVQIADYIEDNYTTHQVYQNYRHPDKCIIWEYARRILRKMNVDYSESYELEERAPRYNHNGCDIPIYPSVIRHLGISWLDENSLYEICFLDHISKLTFKEYITKYVEYVKTAREIMAMQ